MTKRPKRMRAHFWTARPHRREEDTKSKEGWPETFKNVALGVAGVISSVAIPIVGIYITDEQNRRTLEATNRDKEREIAANKALKEGESAQKYIELGIRILSEKPLSENDPVRKWAIEIVNQYSDVKLSPEARSALQTAPFFDSGKITQDRLQQFESKGYTKGIDVSHYNGSVDFEKLRAEGFKFVYVKATEGTTTVDPALERFAKEAKAAGLPVGLYHFYKPSGGPGQVGVFLEVLKRIEWTLPPAIDLEDEPNSENTPNLAADAVSFLETIRSSFNMTPIVYTYKSFADRALNEKLARYPLFVADYSKDARLTGPHLPKWWNSYFLWQVSHGAADDPLLRETDIILFKGSLDALLAAK